MRLVSGMAIAMLAACSSPDPSDRSDDNGLPSEAEQQATVEAAIRRVYAAEGAEVTAVAMERTADGTGYVGTATVRDDQGNSIDVDCQVSADSRGAPEIECNRAGQEDSGPEIF